MFDFEIINNSKIYIIGLLFSQVTFGILFFLSLINVIFILGLVYFSWYLYRKFGLILFVFGFFYLLKNTLVSYMKSLIDDNSKNSLYNSQRINLCLDFSTVSLVLSFLFIFFIYHDNEITKIYSKIYQNIFSLKILFDLALVFHYTYEMYEQNKSNYLISFDMNIHLILLILLIHYFIIFIFLFLKINLLLDITELNNMFESTVMMINKKEYNKNTPIFEIRTYKVF